MCKLSVEEILCNSFRQSWPLMEVEQVRLSIRGCIPISIGWRADQLGI